METYTESYSENPVLTGLNQKEIEEVLQMSQSRWFEKDDIIFKEGDSSHSLYLMDQGSVHIMKNFNGQQHLIARLDARTIFGEMALTTDEPRSASVLALGRVHIHELAAEDFHQMLENNSAAAGKIMINIARVLTLRMNHLLREFNSLISNKNDTKIANTDLNTFKQQVFSNWSF